MANWVVTSEGLIERERLEMRETFEDTDTYCVHAIEYWLGDKLVKRGAHVHMKTGIELKAEVAHG